LGSGGRGTHWLGSLGEDNCGLRPLTAHETDDDREHDQNHKNLLHPFSFLGAPGSDSLAHLRFMNSLPDSGDVFPPSNVAGKIKYLTTIATVGVYLPALFIFR